MNIFNYKRLRSILLLLLINLGMSVNYLNAQQGMGLDTLLSDPAKKAQALKDAQEMKKILETMPPEEVDALMQDALKVYEGLSDKEKNAINDLSQDMIRAEQGMFEPTSAPVQAITQEPIQPKNEIKKGSSKEVRNARDMIETIISMIDSVEDKIASLHRVSDDPTQAERWTKIKKSLDQIAALLRRIINPITATPDLLLRHLTSDEFSSIVTNLKRLHKILQQNEPHIKVPDIMGFKRLDEEEQKETIDQSTKKRSIRAVNNLINQLRRLLLDDLEKSIEKMLQKYEPKKPKKKDAKAPASEMVLPPVEPRYQDVPPYDDYRYGDEYLDYSPQDMYVQEVGATPTKKANVKVQAILEPIAQIKKTIEQEPRLQNITQAMLNKDSDGKIGYALDQIHIYAKDASKNIKKLVAAMAKEPEVNLSAHKNILKNAHDDARILALQAKLSGLPVKAGQTLKKLQSALDNLAA